MQQSLLYIKSMIWQQNLILHFTAFIKNGWGSHFLITKRHVMALLFYIKICSLQLGISLGEEFVTLLPTELHRNIFEGLYTCVV